MGWLHVPQPCFPHRNRLCSKVEAKANLISLKLLLTQRLPYSKEKFTKTLSLRPLPLRFPLDMYELNDCSGVLNMVRSNMDAVLINICIFGRHTYKNHMGVNSQTNPWAGESAICLSKQSVAGGTEEPRVRSSSGSLPSGSECVLAWALKRPATDSTQLAGQHTKGQRLHRHDDVTTAITELYMLHSH